MNKIKIIYDVVQAMKIQETISYRYRTSFDKQGNETIFEGEGLYSKKDKNDHLKELVKKIVGLGNRFKLGFKGRKDDCKHRDRGHFWEKNKKSNDEKWERFSVGFGLVEKLSIQTLEDKSKVFELQAGLKELPESIQLHIIEEFVNNKDLMVKCFNDLNDFKSMENIVLGIQGMIGSKNRLEDMRIEIVGKYINITENPQAFKFHSQLELK